MCCVLSTAMKAPIHPLPYIATNKTNNQEKHYMYDSHRNYYAADAVQNIDSRTKSYHAASKGFPGDDDEAEQMQST